MQFVWVKSMSSVVNLIGGETISVYSLIHCFFSLGEHNTNVTEKKSKQYSLLFVHQDYDLCANIIIIKLCQLIRRWLEHFVLFKYDVCGKNITVCSESIIACSNIIQ